METTMNIFEYAVRNKLRFPFKGSISVEDLWDLPVENLDTIFKILNKASKTNSEESLLDVRTDVDKKLEVQIEIVKYIVSVKLAEKAERQRLATNKEKKQKIMEIIATKQNEALMNSSIEELTKMLNEME